MGDDKNYQNYKSSISEEDSESSLGRERDGEGSSEDFITNVINDVKWYINLPGHYLTGYRYLDDVEDDNESNDDKMEEKTVPLYRGQHQPQDQLEETELKLEMKEKFNEEHQNTQTSHLINVEGGVHPLLYE